MGEGIGLKVEPEWNAEVKRRYREGFAKYGDTAEGALWRDEASRQLRYDQLLKVVKKTPFSVLDFGCGSGSLIPRLELIGMKHYTGVENCDEIRKIAQNKFPDYMFVKSLDQCLEEYDYVFVSGTFNYRAGISSKIWENWVRDTIQQLQKKMRRGMSMNFMICDPDWKDKELWYPKSFDHVMGWFVFMKMTIVKQYGLHEWTLLAEKV